MVKDKSKSRLSVEVDCIEESGMTDIEKKEIFDKFYNYEQNEKYNYILDPYYWVLYSYKYDLKTLEKLLLKKNSFFSKFHMFLNKVKLLAKK